MSHMSSVFLRGAHRLCLVSGLIAVEAGRDNVVDLVSTTFRHGNEMLRCALKQAGGLDRDTVALREQVAIRTPHG